MVDRRGQAGDLLRADVAVDGLFTALWLNACLADHGGPHAKGGGSLSRIALLLNGLRSAAESPLPGGATEAAAVAAPLAAVGVGDGD